jgi:hypothetical protein
VRFVPHWASFIGALRGALAARCDDRSAEEIFGLTGFAFRLTVAPRVASGGWAAFPWAEELAAAVGGLGYASELIYAREGDPRTGALREQAVALLRRARAPVIVFGVQLAEFGLARTGANPETLVVSGTLDNAGGRQTLPTAALGQGDVPILFALALGEHDLLPPAVALASALEQAVRLGHEPWVRGGDAAGLSAYDAWIHALETGHVDPTGHAHAAQLLGEARRHAAQFLASAHLPGADLAAAADEYARVAAATAELGDRFPFPPAAPLDDAGLATATRLLGRARDAEARGLAAISAALRAHAHDHTQSRFQIDDVTPDELYRCLADLPIGDLGQPMEECKREIDPRLGRTFFGKVARDRASGDVVGHVYYAELADSRYPIAAEGRQLFLFCPWVKRSLRGRGIGRALGAALVAHAHTLGADGILTEASTLPIFLHEDGLAQLGFREVARHGETRIMHLALSDRRPVARYLPPTELSGLRIRHAYNCPLLHATRRAAAEVARERGLAVDEAAASGPAAGIEHAGDRLPNLPFGPDVLVTALTRK